MLKSENVSHETSLSSTPRYGSMTHLSSVWLFNQISFYKITVNLPNCLYGHQSMLISSYSRLVSINNMNAAKKLDCFGKNFNTLISFDSGILLDFTVL